MIKPGLILFFAITCWSPAATGQETASDASQFPRDSVVGVFTFAAGKSINTNDLNTMNPSTHGGGVVIDETGRILTVRHLLDDISSSNWKVWARSNLHPEGRLFDARPIVADSWCDLAIMKIQLDGADSLVAAELSGEESTESVSFFANFENMVVGRSQSVVELNWHRQAVSPVQNVFQFGGLAALSPTLDGQRGHELERQLFSLGSGMPIFKGRNLIGLSTAEVKRPGVNSESFAIAGPFFKRCARELIEHEQILDFGFAGITPRDLSDQQQEQAGGLHGVQVISVDNKSPADIAGLQFSDVITHLDSQPIANVNRFQQLIGQNLAGQTVSASVVRGALNGTNTSEKLTIQIRLSKRRVDLKRSSFQVKPLASWRGLRVDYPSATANYRSLQVLLDRKGCVVASHVEIDSLAWQGGIREGTVILTANGNQVNSPTEFYAALNPDSGQRVTLTIVDANTLESAPIVVPAK